MNTYSRLVDGFAVDVVSTPPSLESRFNPAWLSANTFYPCPGDTLPGRPGTLQPDGTVVWGQNPPPPPPPPAQYQLLSASGFQDTCETGLGGNSTGAIRFGAIIRAMQTSNDDLVLSLYQRFVKSTTFDRAKAATMFSVLVAKGIMTAGERTAILAAWPTV